MLRLLINLHDATDRYSAAEEMLAREGVEFERIEAVDGRGKPTSMFPQYDALRALRFYGRELTSGEIGCYLSHLQCVERFLQSNETYCLVLEDDMSAPENLAPILDQLVSSLENHDGLDWDVINLGKAARKFRTSLGVVDGYQLFHAHYFPVTTTALLWSRRGAQAFWDTRGAIFAPVDHYLRRFCCLRGTGLCLDPPLIVPTGVESMIDAEGITAATQTSQKARKRMDKTLAYFWKEFRRQAANYNGAIRNQLKARHRMKHPR